MKGQEKRRAYWVLFIVNFLSCLGFGIADPFFPVYVTQNGATGFHIALMFSGYSAAKMLVSPLSGWWSDLKGRRGLLIVGLGTHLLAAVCFLLLSDLAFLILLKFILGFAAGIVRPVLLAFVGDMAPDRRQGVAMGTFDISFYGALAIGPIIGGVVQQLSGFPGIFLALSVLCAASFVAALFFRKSYDGHPRGPKEARGRKKALKLSRTFVALCVFSFTKSFGITLLAIFLPIFMFGTLKLKGIEMGVVMGSATVATTLLLTPMGILSDRVNRVALVVAGGITAALIPFCLPFAQNFSQLLLMIAVIGVFNTVSLPASTALLVKEGYALGMGTTAGIFNSAMNLGALIGPVVGGACLTYFGINAVFSTASIVGLAGVLSFAFLAHSARAHRRRGD